MAFPGNYLENTLKVYIPTQTLEEEGKIRVNLICDPNCISDDEKRIQYGNWDTAVAYLYNKEGSELFESNNFELKIEQGPNKPSSEPLAEEVEEIIQPVKQFLFKNVKNHKLYKPAFALSNQERQAKLGSRPMTGQQPRRIAAVKPPSAMARKNNKSIARK